MNIAVRIGLLLALTLALPAMSTAEEASQPTATGGITADCARVNVSCRALESCAQACGYLHQCKLDKLDRDKDGIPCESLCTRPCDVQG
jgi:hypothetical protein